jgi:hypothetical protein
VTIYRTLSLKSFQGLEGKKVGLIGTEHPNRWSSSGKTDGEAREVRRTSGVNLLPTHRHQLPEPELWQLSPSSEHNCLGKGLYQKSFEATRWPQTTSSAEGNNFHTFQ